MKELSYVKVKKLWAKEKGREKKQFISKSNWETKDYGLSKFEFNKYVCVQCKQEWNQAWKNTEMNFFLHFYIWLWYTLPVFLPQNRKLYCTARHIKVIIFTIHKV